MGKYTLDELLRLRASPLVCKPADLPAIEEFLSTADTAAKRPTARAKPDESTTQAEGFPKRPLLDSQHRKSTTDPDRIVLGPPRRSFASANARTTGKGSNESPDDTSTSSRTTFEKFKNGDGENRKSQTNGRHDISDEKSRRKLDEEEDKRPRRDYDRKLRWAGVDDEQPQRNKLDQPWSRYSRGADSIDDTKREGTRHQDWRRDRGKDRGWDRPAPAEEDPEWMDEPMEEQAAPARTQEDFQRWKERMKAGKNTTTNAEDVIHTPASPEPTSGKSQKPAHTFVDAEADDSMDKFFARFNDTKITTEPAATTKATTKTRFASLFSPQAEQPPQQPHSTKPKLQMQDFFAQEKPVQTPIEAPTADADQAGFARILEMLQGRSQAASASQPQESRDRVPLYARDSQNKQESDRPPPPGLMGLLSQPRPPTAENQPPQMHERGRESMSPVDHGHARQQSNKDELLLNLLRQANQAPKPTPAPHPHEQYGGRGMFSQEDILNRGAIARNQMVSPQQQPDLSFIPRRENGRSTMDEPHQASLRYQEEPIFHEHLTRRSTNEGPRNMNDEQLLHFLRNQGMNQQQKPLQPAQQQPQGPPPGLARPPPGLDQLSRAPPGWPNQQPQPQPQRQPALPPGMPNLPRNIPAQFGGPNIPTSHQKPSQRPPQPPQPPPQRKYTSDSGMPSFPPMGPPPGFMNNGPPPGFPGQGYGRYHGPPEPGPPPQGLGRAFMDMYGDGGRAGVRGGGPPGYR